MVNHLVLIKPAKSPNPKPSVTGIPIVCTDLPSRSDNLNLSSNIANNGTLLTFLAGVYLLQARDLAFYWEKGYQALSSSPPNYKEAAFYLNKVLQISPNDSAALDNEGASLFQLGDHNALKFFDRPIALNSTNLDVYWDKAYALLIGTTTQAPFLLLKVLSITPESAAALSLTILAAFNSNLIDDIYY